MLVSDPPFISILRECGWCGGAGCQIWIRDNPNDIDIYHDLVVDETVVGVLGPFEVRHAWTGPF